MHINCNVCFQLEVVELLWTSHYDAEFLKLLRLADGVILLLLREKVKMSYRHNVMISNLEFVYH